MGREDKKEPISDLTEHNLREEEVRVATKRLDEYLVTKYDLNKPNPLEKVGRKTRKIRRPSEAKEGIKPQKSKG